MGKDKTMWNRLIWLYMMNATLLIVHEIDSAFWKEWDLFGLPGGISGFLIIHLPMVFIILWGLLLLARQSRAGILISGVLAAGGIFAFCIHNYFIWAGNPQFKTLVSMSILSATLLVSLIQGWFIFRALRSKDA